MKLEKLIILNCAEKPCAKLVCRVYSNNCIKYINKYLRKHFKNMRRGDGWATLKSYGFIKEIRVIDNAKIEYFVLKNPSKVKYSDGKIRKWQGKNEFTYKEIMEMSSYDFIWASPPCPTHSALQMTRYYDEK